MTRDETRGQIALRKIDQMVEPRPTWVGANADKLYKAEEQRAEYTKRCAKEWAKVMGVGEDMFWKQSVPQSLYDMLECFDTQCGVIAAEAFLKRLGWKIERPELHP